MRDDSSNARLSLSGGVLAAGGVPLFDGLDPDFSLDGSFLSLPRAPSEKGAGPWRHVSLGRPARVAAFAGQVHKHPFWFAPARGADPATIAGAAPWLLLKRDDGLFVLLVALPSGNAASYLTGSRAGGALRLYRTTGNAALAPSGGRVLHAAAGRDPRALLASSARAVAAAMPDAALRADKPSPPFEDFFGWCTWNAFYHSVSEKKVLEGLESFRRNGVKPGFVIVDDGWQRDTPRTPLSNRYLAGFEPDPAKFPRGLAPVVRAAKRRFGVKKVLAWLTAQGLPAGLDPVAFRRFRPGVATPQPDRHVDVAAVFDWYDSQVLRFPADWRGFLRERFARLRGAGVDGVKVDFQGALFFGAARSRSASRVAEARRMRGALEETASAAFGRDWLSCMAHLPEIFYHARRDNLTRGSDDFFPDVPASHGEHVLENAFTGLWFGAFTGVDWDMFESAHPFGAYHAAARALSGGPVYTADKPGAVDPAVIRRACFADGRVPRFPDPATPAVRSLFPEPGDDPRAFVVVNAGPAAGCAGLFDADTAAPPRAVRAKLRPCDVPGLPAAARYAVWDGRARPRFAAPAAAVALAAGRAERFAVATFAPVLGGRFAAFGLENLYAPAAALLAAGLDGDTVAVRIAGGGRFAAWSAARPVAVRAGRKAVPFTWNPATGLLRADVPDEPGARPEFSVVLPPARARLRRRGAAC